jgi:cellulose biosynthesis protein BcsQ
MGELAQHGPVSPTVIYQRTDFASSMTDGRTAGELDPSGRSAAEITALWNFIAKRLEKQKSAPAHHSAHRRNNVHAKIGVKA